MTHFPPSDSYVSAANVEDVLKSFSNFKNKEEQSHVRISLFVCCLVSFVDMCLYV